MINVDIEVGYIRNFNLPVLIFSLVLHEANYNSGLVEALYRAAAVSLNSIIPPHR